MSGHAGYIFAAYAFTALVVLSLIGWSITTYRAQQRALAGLESRLGRTDGA